MVLFRSEDMMLNTTTPNYYIYKYVEKYLRKSSKDMPPAYLLRSILSIWLVSLWTPPENFSATTGLESRREILAISLSVTRLLPSWSYSLYIISSACWNCFLSMLLVFWPLCGSSNRRKNPTLNSCQVRRSFLSTSKALNMASTYWTMNFSSDWPLRLL